MKDKSIEQNNASLGYKSSLCSYFNIEFLIIRTVFSNISETSLGCDIDKPAKIPVEPRG